MSKAIDKVNPRVLCLTQHKRTTNSLYQSSTRKRRLSYRLCGSLLTSPNSLQNYSHNFTTPLTAYVFVNKEAHGFTAISFKRNQFSSAHQIVPALHFSFTGFSDMKKVVVLERLPSYINERIHCIFFFQRMSSKCCFDVAKQGEASRESSAVIPVRANRMDGTCDAQSQYVQKICGTRL